MLTDAARLRRLTRRPFLAREAVQAGLLTRAQLHSAGWRRLLRGVYADARLPVDHDLMIDAASLLLPPGAAVTGCSAAHFWRAELAAPDDPVSVIVPRGVSFGPVAGLTIQRGPIAPDELIQVANITVTHPLRAAWDIARSLDIVDAVAWLDSLAGKRKLTRADLPGYADGRPGEYGWRKVRRAFALVEPRAESPPESRVRAHLVLAGLPEPLVQHEVRHNGRFVARVDLAMLTQRLAIEYDGAWHAGSGQLALDRQRWRALHAASWLVHPVTRFDLRDPHRMVAEIRAVLLDRSQPSEANRASRPGPWPGCPRGRP